MGLKSIPSVVQLPGGVKIQSISFVITEYDDEGKPKTFEVVSDTRPNSVGEKCVLFANEEWIRKVRPEHIKK